MTVVLNRVWWAALICVLWVGSSPAAPKSYLALGPDGLTVTWLKNELPPSEGPLKLFVEHRPLAEVPVLHTQQVSYARIPADVPWKDGKLSYQIPGEEALISINSANLDEKVKLSLITDTHVSLDDGKSKKRVKKAMGRALAFGANAIGVNGDFVENGTCPEWITFFNAAQDVLPNLPLIASRGNHEEAQPWGKAVSGHWEDFFPDGHDQGFFAYVMGPLKVIVLNSNFIQHPELLGAQQRFFEAAMQDRALFNIVMVHHPVYPLEKKALPYVGWILRIWQQWTCKKSRTLVRKYMGPLFDKYKPDVVFSGHEHTFYRTNKKGVTYVGGGVVGGEKRKQNKWYPAHGRLDAISFGRSVAHIEVDAHSLRMKTETLKEGIPLDEFVLEPQTLDELPTAGK